MSQSNPTSAELRARRYAHLPKSKQPKALPEKPAFTPTGNKAKDAKLAANAKAGKRANAPSNAASETIKTEESPNTSDG